MGHAIYQFINIVIYQLLFLLLLLLLLLIVIIIYIYIYIYNFLIRHIKKYSN